MSENKLKVGDIIFSGFFNQFIEIVLINSDDDWYFKLGDRILKAQTPLPYFEKEKKDE